MPNSSRAFFTPANLAGGSVPTQYGQFSRIGVFTAPIATDGYAEFPLVGPAAGGVVPSVAFPLSAFVLPTPGDYEVAFALNVPEQPSAWLIELTDGGPPTNLLHTVAGGATATATVAQKVLIRTTTAGATIRIKSRTTGAVQLATPAIGPEQSSATLAIVRVG